MGLFKVVAGSQRGFDLDSFCGDQGDGRGVMDRLRGMLKNPRDCFPRRYRGRVNPPSDLLDWFDSALKLLDLGLLDDPEFVQMSEFSLDGLDFDLLNTITLNFPHLLSVIRGDGFDSLDFGLKKLVFLMRDLKQGERNVKEIVDELKGLIDLEVGDVSPVYYRSYQVVLNRLFSDFGDLDSDDPRVPQKMLALVCQFQVYGLRHQYLERKESVDVGQYYDMCLSFGRFCNEVQTWFSGFEGDHFFEERAEIIDVLDNRLDEVFEYFNLEYDESPLYGKGVVLRDGLFPFLMATGEDDLVLEKIFDYLSLVQSDLKEGDRFPDGEQLVLIKDILELMISEIDRPDLLATLHWTLGQILYYEDSVLAAVDCYLLSSEVRSAENCEYKDVSKCQTIVHDLVVCLPKKEAGLESDDASYSRKYSFEELELVQRWLAIEVSFSQPGAKAMLECVKQTLDSEDCLDEAFSSLSPKDLFGVVQAAVAQFERLAEIRQKAVAQVRVARAPVVEAPVRVSDEALAQLNAAKASADELDDLLASLGGL